MRECLALMISFLLMTRAPVWRFNRYIFSIKYIMFLWRNCFDNIGDRTKGRYHCFGRQGRRGNFLLPLKLLDIRRDAFLYRLALRLRVRITHLSVHRRRTGTGHLRQFDRDTDLKLKESWVLINFICTFIKK